MFQPAITGTGVFTPSLVITNAELVDSFNAYAEKFNAENAAAIAAGEVEAKEPSSVEFIFKASGIEQRYVLEKEGILDPDRMYPNYRQRSDDEPGIMTEIAMDACAKALAQAGVDASEIDLVICAASNMERAYPAIGVEIQKAIGAGGFAFDMNVACSSATFGIQAAADMIRAGWSPSVRLFEAGACATPIISDRWPGIEELFVPGREIVLADTAGDVLAALDGDARAMGRAARARIEAGHSADHRAAELEAHLAEAQAAAGRAGEPDSAARVVSKVEG